MEKTKRDEAQHRRKLAHERFINKPLWKLPGWVAAHARLLELLPTAREKIAAPYDLCPDAIFCEAERAGVESEFALLRNPWRGNPAGGGTRSWASYDEVELFDVIFSRQAPTPGALWFVPDECFGEEREPYLLRGETIRDFVLTTNCSLHDDAIFIWCETRRVTVIHHEGGYAHLFVPEANTPAER